MFNLYNFQPDIKNIVLLSSGGRLYSEGVMRYCLNDVDASKISWFKETQQNNGLLTLLPHLKQEGTIIYNYDNTEGSFAIARLIREIETNREIGAIRIDIPFKKIEDIFGTADSKDAIKIVVLDRNDKLVVDCNNVMDRVNWDEHMKIFSLYKDRDSGYYEFGEGKNKYMVVYSNSSYTGWSILGLIPQDRLLEKSRFSRNLSVFLSSLGVVIIVSLCSFISIAISKPIKVLQASMHKVEKGDFSTSIKVKSSDEIGYLGHSFNKMVKRIDNLIKKEYELTIRKREAELKALMEEINPHFLYNTLEGIRGKAVKHKATDVAKIIEELSKFLRLNIIRGDGITTLKEELEHTKSYVFIQNMRYANRFNCVIDVEDDLLNAKIPKLSMQPFVENSIMHGFKLQKGECMIFIHAHKNEGRVIVKIADNGRGIEERTLENIKQILSNPYKTENEFANQHLGIKNVHERIKLHFGEEYGASIESKIGEGVTVVLSIPWF